MGLLCALYSAYTKVMEMLMRTQSARVCMLALGTIITNSFVHTPSYAIGSVSIVHRNEHPLSITASTSPEGSMTVMEDNLSVITDNEAGYSLYISTNSQTNYLASGNGDAIYSTSSTTDSPAVLDRDSWGFAIPSTTDHAVISGFDADYEHLIASSDGKPSGLWAAVPVKSDMTLVQKTETNGAFDLDVYYGFNISYKTSPGSYTGTVLYTAVANAAETYEIGEFSIIPGTTDNLAGGTEIQLAAPITPDFDSPDIGIVNVKIGEQSCDEATGYVQDGMLYVECLAPALPAGTYDVKVSLIGLDGSDHSIEQGYTVSLDSDSHDISVQPSEVIVDTAGIIDISTSIRTAGLSSDDIEISIGDSPCVVEETSYDDQNQLSISCSYTEYSEPGTFLVQLIVLPYQEVFSGELSVRNRTNLTDLTYMQEMTSEICSNTTTPSPNATELIDSFYDGTDKIPTKTLTDQRDGKTYTVSKLSDGNCWMTQNLYLGGEEELILTDTDTDVEDEFTLPPAQTSGSQGWKNDTPHVYDTGSSTTGGLYNWIAATGGVGTYGEISEETDQSICPRGWTLPSLAGETSFTGLFAAYGWADRAQVVDQLTIDPFNFVFSGGYYYGYGGTSNGEYWTSSPAENENDAYYIKLESLSRRVFLTNTKPRSGGAAIRCVTTGHITSD